MIKIAFEKNQSSVEMYGKLTDVETELTCAVHDALVQLAEASGLGIDIELKKFYAALQLVTVMKGEKK